MKKNGRNYDNLTEIAKKCNLVPHLDRIGHIVEGSYTLEGYEAPIDLSACAEDEVSILKTALEQLSKFIDDVYHMSIERDLLD